jgi:hypothetical protein
VTELRASGGVLVALLASSAVAATVSAEFGEDRVGEPISQTFLSEQVSMTRSYAGDACVASAPIAIQESLYVAPDGAAVAFDEVVRSRGSSVQYVAPVGGGGPFFRIQFKYTPDPAYPVRLQAGAVAIDLAPLIELSGDSVVIAEPGAVNAVRAAMAGGAPVLLEAVSRDTGRRVTDRLPEIDFTGVAVCQDHAGTIAYASETPLDSLGLGLRVARDETSLVTPDAARICGMAEPVGEIHRGVLVWTTGFFAQTRKVLAVFDEADRIAHVYVPGVFEVRRGPDGALAGDASIAANANLPLEENRVRGCLGHGPIAVFAFGEIDGVHILSAPVGRLALGALPGDLTAGDLLSADLFEDAVLLGDFVAGGAYEASGVGSVLGGGLLDALARGPGSGLAGAFGGGLGSPGSSPAARSTPGYTTDPGDPTDPGGPTDLPPATPPAVIPVPAALGLMISAFGALLLAAARPSSVLRRVFG